MSIEKTIEAIKKFERFLILSHIDLEGDSIGSQFAFRILLEKMGKTGTVVNEGKPPMHYAFLGVNESIITDLKRSFDYEAIAVLDCPVAERVGKAKKFLDNKKAVLINIDHHVSNLRFGDINWVEPDTSSCGEMIYKLYKTLKVPIDKECAKFLYVAALTDTGSFAYENTSSTTHAMAAELLEEGLKADLIYRSIYENKSTDELALLRDALSTIKVTANGKAAHMYVSLKMLKRHSLGLEVTEGFINYARSIGGVEVAVMFFEDPARIGEIQISFRSKGRIDVDRLASRFGGGGHKNASGCVLRGSLKSVMGRVLDGVNKSIDNVT